MFVYISKLKKILTWTLLIAIFCSGFLMGFSKPQVAKAWLPGDLPQNTYNNSYWPELADFSIGGQDLYRKKIPILNNYFKVGSKEYKTTYTEAFLYNNTDDFGHCWKMTSSEYFAVQGEYYYCATGGKSKSGTSFTQETIFVPLSNLSGEVKENGWWVQDNGKYYISIRNNNDRFNKATQGISKTEADYLYYVAQYNQNWNGGVQIKNCPEVLKGGKSFTKEDYEYCLFADNGTFNVPINTNGTPTITIKDKKLSNGQQRPQIIFTLKQVMKSDGIAGFGGVSQVYFYFVATSPSYPNLSIRIIGCEANRSGEFALANTLADLSDDTRVSGADIIIDEKSWKAFNDKVYQPGATDRGCPNSELNSKALEDMGTTVTQRNDSGEGESDCEKSFKCTITSKGLFGSTVCKAQCAVVEFLSSIIKFMVETVLFKSLGISS